MTRPDPQWQRQTALRKVDQFRTERQSQGRPYTDRMAAEFAAKQVGSSVEVVLGWMGVSA